MNKQILTLCFAFATLGCGQPISPKKTLKMPTTYGTMADSAMVVTSSQLATDIGAEVLRTGGNAFDAAVAVQFALAVAYPRAGNIGGGGFMVYRLANGDVGSLDFREKAPAAAAQNMYLDTQQNVIPNLSRKGHLAVGVPGSVAGMEAMHQKFGKKKWQDLVYPAARIAQGFVLLTREANRLNAYQKDFVETDSIAHPYISKKKWHTGDTLKNPALHRTLLRIAAQGSHDFYKGETARLIVAEMRRHAGIITHADLAAYRPVWRTPIIADYKGYKIISMPPPSSGGIALAQLLAGTAPHPIARWGHNSAKHAHLMIELERRVYADRAEYLADPDFVQVPTQKLLDNTYLKQRFSTIDPNKKTNSQDIKAGSVQAIEHFETTHFSIVDAQGNAVAITTTLNDNYGSRVAVDGAGFLLNDEMDDFSAKPGVPNMFGLVGNAANAIEPHKRMLSSMSPTIIVNPKKQLLAVLGTPGGSTIITTIYQCILNIIDFEMTIQQAITAPKIHAQWLPDEVYAEKSFFDSPQKQILEKMGHIFKQQPLGLLDCIMIHKNQRIEGAHDPTKEDGKAAGF